MQQSLINHSQGKLLQSASGIRSLNQVESIEVISRKFKLMIEKFVSESEKEALQKVRRRE